MNRKEIRDELVNLVKNGCNGKQCTDCFLYHPELQCFCNKING